MGHPITVTSEKLETLTVTIDLYTWGTPNG